MVRLENILDRVKEYRKNPDLDIIKRAYIYASIHHGADQRKSGEPFIIHPLEVANVLTQMKCDETTVAAGLLHDVVEDTQITTEDIKKFFGDEIAFLVESVTKVDALDFKTNEEKQAENVRKLLLGMVKDVRAILIKLSDRLHNMRTLHYIKPEKQKLIAKETLEIYAPLAHRLGIYWIKTEIEDRAFMTLYPEKYKDIENKLAKFKKRKEKHLEERSKKLKNMLFSEGIECEVYGRFKSPYSIYQKMIRENLPFEEVYDIIAFRVITNSVMDCYKVLGIIHQHYKPIFERFKDYISRPKSNNYQSIHTTVIGDDLEKIEIQIRTWEMHKEAEEGIAAHWAYKEGKEKPTEGLKIYNWFKKLLELKEDQKDPVLFLYDVKEDLFSDEIFVFTPDGDIKELPKGSTPVDFAYTIHTEVGHRCKGAEVNGKIVPLNTVLKNGDKVRIITGKESNPRKDWLTFVKSSRARNKIKAWINAREREGFKKIGKQLFEREMRKYGKSISRMEKKEKFKEALKSHGFQSEESFFIAIGAGKLNLKSFIRRAFHLEEEKRETEKITSIFPRIKRKTSEVIVDGMSDIYVKFAKCCNPLPGEKIVGHISTKKGLIVHSARCNRISTIPQDRFIDVRWGSSNGSVRKTKLTIECEDKPGLLALISQAISSENVNIADATAKPAQNSFSKIIMHVEIESYPQLERIIGKIGNIKGVMKVRRG